MQINLAKLCTGFMKWLCTFSQSFYQSHEIFLPCFYIPVTLHIFFIPFHMLIHMLISSLGYYFLYLFYSWCGTLSCVSSDCLDMNPCLSSRFLLLLLQFTWFLVDFYHRNAFTPAPIKKWSFWWKKHNMIFDIIKIDVPACLFYLNIL